MIGVLLLLVIGMIVAMATLAGLIREIPHNLPDDLPNGDVPHLPDGFHSSPNTHGAQRKHG